MQRDEIFKMIIVILKNVPDITQIMRQRSQIRVYELARALNSLVI